MKRKILIALCALLTTFYGYSQQKNGKIISGKILSSETGIYLQGASIHLKESHSSSITDATGQFKITLARPSDTLIITHIGYTQKRVPISKDKKGPLTIRMNPLVSRLKSIVVSTGYQDIPQERATGSFDFISNKTLNQQTSTGILSRLEAIANGLYVDRSTLSIPGLPEKIHIRGLSTIRGPSDPLIVVDNFPYSGDIRNINPNDVENITILKDAAAASIWGAKAGNGVIVINLKKGSYNRPITANAKASISLIDKPDLFANSRISTSDEIDLEEYLFNKGYRLSDTGRFEKPVISPVYEILLKERNGIISSAEANNELNALRKIDIRKQFEKYMYQKAVNQQYSVNVNGGGKTFAWLFSSGYDHNIDQLAAKYDRVNLRWENTYRPLKNLQLNTGIYYTMTTNISGKPAFGTIHPNVSRGIYPYAQLAGPNGEVIPLAMTYRPSYIDTLGGGKLLDWKYYPLTDYKHNVSNTKGQDVLINLGADYKILRSLDMNVKYQYEKGTTLAKTLHDTQSYYTRDLINSYTNLEATDDGQIYSVPNGSILDLNNDGLISQSFRAQINYNKSWGKNTLAAIIGSQINEKNTTMSANRLYGFNSETLTFTNVDYVNEYPSPLGFPRWIPNRDEQQYLMNRFISFYGNAAYTYHGKYTISASGRRDASNIFGVKINDKWKPLWSSGIGWKISDEKFFHSRLLTYLKMRATFGYSGNVDPGRAGATTIRYIGRSSQYVLTPYARFGSYENPDLKWETSSQLNIGFDFQLKNNIIRGSLDYYHKRNTNLYAVVPIDYTDGIGPTINKNAATSVGSGLDLALNSKNINRKFRWTTNLNLSYNADKVKKYYLPDATRAAEFVGRSGKSISALVGRPVYAIYAFRWGGLDPATGDPQGYADGKISKDYRRLTLGSTFQEIVYKGAALPTFFGSCGNTFSWKGWSLTARLTYKFGYSFIKDALYYSELFQTWTSTADFSERWQKPGDEKSTNVPSLIYPSSVDRDELYDYSEVNVLKGGFIRLQYITINYQPPIKKSTKFPINSLQIYGNISDLGVIWRANKYGIDPEYQGSIPPPRSISIGIQGSF